MIQIPFPQPSDSAYASKYNSPQPPIFYLKIFKLINEVKDRNTSNSDLVLPEQLRNNIKWWDPLLASLVTHISNNFKCQEARIALLLSHRGLSNYCPFSFSSFPSICLFSAAYTSLYSLLISSFSFILHCLFFFPFSFLSISLVSVSFYFCTVETLVKLYLKNNTKRALPVLHLFFTLQLEP